MKPTTTEHNVTDRQLRALREEAASAGDWLTVAIADRYFAERPGGDGSFDVDNYTVLSRADVRDLHTLYSTPDACLANLVECIRDAQAAR